MNGAPVTESGTRNILQTHLSRDKAAAKMGHPLFRWRSSFQISWCFGYSVKGEGPARGRAFLIATSILLTAQKLLCQFGEEYFCLVSYWIIEYLRLQWLWKLRLGDLTGFSWDRCWIQLAILQALRS